MAATNGNPHALSVLLAAALALPGLDAHAADENLRADDYVLTYTHGGYAESGGRMRVRVDAATLTAPIGDRLEVKAGTIRDIVTGASVFSNILVNGKPTQVKTGASIRDQRDVFTVGAGYYGDDYYAGIDFGHSTENDYIANFVNARYRRNFNDKSTTLLISGGLSRDVVWEKYYPPFGLPEERQRRRQQDLSVGVTQILDQNSVAQAIVSYSYGSGFLSSQYRRPAVMNGFVPAFLPDSRPDNHTQWTVLARYSRYFASTRSAVHLDYRLGIDSWGANSHMIEGKWRFNLGDGWFVSPGARYYTQKSASFYDVVFTPATAGKHMSSDYRLAGFGAVSPKLEVVKKLDKQFAVVFSYEYYLRKRSYAMSGSRGSDIDDYQSRFLTLSLERAF